MFLHMPTLKKLLKSAYNQSKLTICLLYTSISDTGHSGGSRHSLVFCCLFNYMEEKGQGINSHDAGFAVRRAYG